MHGFCGWHSLIPGDPADGHARLDRSIAHRNWPGVAGDRTTAAAARRDALASDGHGRTALICGHPRWRDARLADIARTAGAAAALLAGWQTHGAALPEQLVGDFALVVVDAPAGRVFAATDRIGRHPLFYAFTAHGVAFGTTADAVASAPGVDIALRPQAVFAYLYFHMVPSPLTIRAGIAKLPAAHAFDWRGTPIEARCWWMPTFREDTPGDSASLGAEMHRLIRTSVAELASDARTGAFLSGGLDSSTVTGMLAGTQAGGTDSFSIGFDVPGYDEIAYARIAAGHFGTRQHEYYLTPADVLAAIPLIAAHYDEPFGNSSAIAAYYCARLARDSGIERLMAGDGGDELFAGNERYAKQKIFETWSAAPAPARRLLETIARTLPRRLPLSGKMQSYIDQANVPLPHRLETYNFLQRLDLGRMFDADFLAQVDSGWPARWLHELWHRPAEASTLNRMMYLDWQRTLADNDLRKVQRTCELAGIDVVYPLLDDDLIEFSCRVPSRLKLPGRQLRHFYKQAMRGFLPDSVLKKSKHGFGLPFGIWMHDHAPLRELAYDSLLALKKRNWLRPTFIDEAIALHRTGHAAYYGELVWILMMLELWLASHSN